MQSCEFVMAITALACLLSEGKTQDETALLGSLFSQLGDTLSTIAGHQALCTPTSTQSKPEEFG